MPQLKNNLVYGLLISVSISCYSQNFDYSANLTPVTKSGYTKIKLDPKFLAVCQSDLSDVRILNKQKKEVPYLIRRNTHNHKYQQTSAAFNIVSKKSIKNSYTEIKFENPELKEISEIVLTIANSNISKTYSIEGSNNQSQWYAISQGSIDDINHATALSTNKEIRLPKTKYAYYNIRLNDSQSAPINITRIFSKKYNEEWNTNRSAINGCKVKWNLKGNDNLIEVSSDFPFQLNELLFVTSQTNFFQRDIRIFTTEKRKQKSYEINLYQGHISHKELLLSGLEINATHFFIQVYNHNNQPLQLTNLIFYQHPTYLIAELETSQEYSINAGQKWLSPPIYDLTYLSEQISDSIPSIDMPDFEIQTKQIANPTLQFYEKKWFLWSVLALGSILIIYISSQIIHKLNTNK
ncbi:MAG: hypothetical protein ACK5UE_03205 [Chitinophagales bacterium]|jgi:hypothetical protein|nr:hypothetical protein [Sphingobacteriales bacterium]